MQEKTIPKNVIALPYQLCGPVLSDSAVFCLNFAKARNYEIDEIWVLGGAANTFDVELGHWFPSANVISVHLDPERYPQDIGNNNLLSMPIILYERVKKAPPNRIVVPVEWASAYFAIMAKKGGILPRSCKVIQTCYLPTLLAQAASLLLPETYQSVVNADLERWCLKSGENIIITHECVRKPIEAKLNISLEHAAVPKTKKPRVAAKGTGRHIVYAGEPTPAAGFDAFCDLARDLGEQLEQISLFLPTRHQNATNKNVHIRDLKAQGANLYWYSHADQVDFKSVSDAILISAMRAPVFPIAAQKALNSGMSVVWGGGFSTWENGSHSSVFYSVSDWRKLNSRVREIWGIDNQNQELRDPESIPPVSERKALAPAPVSQSKKPIRLSVVVIHHERLKLLEQTLSSLAMQSDRNFQLVLVDDGSRSVSSGDLEELVLKLGFKDYEISRIRNSYPAQARNHGAMVASGNTLMFLDDDNLIASQTISSFKKAIVDADIVASFLQTFNGDGIPESTDLLPITMFAGLLPNAGMFHNLLGNSCIMVTKKFFLERGGYSAKYGVGFEDYAFLLSAAISDDCAFTVLPEPFLHFRNHGEKISKTHIGLNRQQKLQASHWRIFDDLAQKEGVKLVPALAYARQLHEVVNYQHIQIPRPKFFRLRSIIKHQYVLPFLQKFKK